ncbi:hypothetical protein [Lysinibacillus sp. FSL W8-0992]|uniref:hypothetical protein n=1 Tax=Lysinibacillus sp. FSL W8-0992 TaxID=2954643 RepID=UPI0030F6269D
MSDFIAIVGVLSFISLITFSTLTYKKFKQNNKAQGMKFLKFAGISFLLMVGLMSLDNLLEKPADSAKADAEKTTVTVDKDEQAKKEAELKAQEEEKRVAKEAEEKALAEQIAKQEADKPEEVNKSEEQKAIVTETTPTPTTQVNTTDTSETILVNDMKKIINDKLGKKNNLKKNTINDIQYVAADKGAIIALNANENLTKNMTKKGMWLDSKDILKPLSKVEGLDIIIIHWYFPLVDTYGNEKDGIVMSFEINKETLNKINWDNFLTDNIPNVVNNYFEHQAFQN